MRVVAARAHRGSWMEHDLSHKKEMQRQAKEDRERVVRELNELRAKENKKIKDLKKKSE